MHINPFKNNAKKAELIKLLEQDILSKKVVKTKKTNFKNRRIFKPQLERVTPQKLLDEASNLNVRVKISSNDPKDMKTGAIVVGYGNESFSGRMGVVKLNTPVTMPLVMVKQLETVMMPVIDYIGDGDSSILKEAVDNVRYGYSYKSAQHMQPKYVITYL